MPRNKNRTKRKGGTKINSRKQKTAKKARRKPRSKARSKKMNPFMKLLQKARKAGAKNFKYKNKTYSKHQTKKGFVYYK